MADLIKIKKGLDIKLEGGANPILMNAKLAQLYAVKPTDYHGVTPKLVAKAGETVKAGDPLFFDKANPEVIFPSPVSGEVLEIVRGDRRKLLEIVVKADKQIEYVSFDTLDPKKASADDIKSKMLKAGVWQYVKQRPFDLIANPSVAPRDIFVSTFDTTPLTADSQFVLTGQEAELQAGFDALAKLTEGKVYVGINANTASKVASSLKGVELVKFSGVHPAGNVGTQIHKIAPVNKGETVWTVGFQDVIIIGRLFLTGKYDATRTISLSGAQVEKPCHCKVIAGAAIDTIIEGQIKDIKNSRIISGTVFSGEKITKNGYLGAYDNAITVIPESGDADFMGWGMPAFDKFSVHKTVGSTFLGKLSKVWNLDARLNGEERGIVMSNEYDKVFPWDILPEYLLKAIITKDLDQMEQLGIYEIAPEDFALCEVVCTSKLKVQAIVRDGLDYLMKEIG